MSVPGYEDAFRNAGMKLVDVKGYGMMQSLIEWQGKIIHLVAGPFKKKTEPAKTSSNPSLPSSNSSAKGLINSYYKFLYSLDFNLLGKVPFQNSAFLVFQKK
jgi:hypothetical protein